MTIHFPSGYTLSGTSNDGNTVEARRNDSSPAAPVVCKVTRKYASFNQGTKRFSVPQVEIRFTRGLREGDPLLPIQEQELASFTFREPVGHDSETLNVFKDLLAMLGQAGMYKSLVAQVLPNFCAPVTP